MINRENFVTKKRFFETKYMRSFDAIDPILGFTTQTESICSKKNFENCYNIISCNKNNESPESCKIMFIGGNFFKNNSKFLINELSKKHTKNLTFYEGNCETYNSQHQLIKLYRDIISINPNLVLNIGGNEDFSKESFPNHPTINYFQHDIATFLTQQTTAFDLFSHGLPNNAKKSYSWITNSKMMEFVCYESKSLFLQVLEPFSEIDYSNYNKDGEISEISDYIKSKSNLIDANKFFSKKDFNSKGILFKSSIKLFFKHISKFIAEKLNEEFK